MNGFDVEITQKPVAAAGGCRKYDARRYGTSSDSSSVDRRSFVAVGFGDSNVARAVAGALQLAALVVAVLAATDMHLHGLQLALVAAVGVLAAVLAAFSGDIPQGVGAQPADIVVAAVILSIVLRRVLRHERVTVQTLYGAVCAYFLIGLMFGSIYAGLDLLQQRARFRHTRQWVGVLLLQLHHAPR